MSGGVVRSVSNNVLESMADMFAENKTPPSTPRVYNKTAIARQASPAPTPRPPTPPPRPLTPPQIASPVAVTMLLRRGTFAFSQRPTGRAIPPPEPNRLMTISAASPTPLEQKINNLTQTITEKEGVL